MRFWFVFQTVLWAATWIGAIITVVLSRRMKGERLMLVKAMDIIEDQRAIIDCLASRGKIECDSCGKPIAPGTPTAIDEYEPHRWRIEHAGCVTGADVP